MSIKIVVDSASDITQKEAEELGIIVVPIEVRIGEKDYLDGVDLTFSEFYEKLKKVEVLPKTSLINEYRWSEEFKKLTEDGSEVVAITLSSKLSGTYKAAVSASKDYSSQVFVVDSMSATAGMRLLASYAISLIKRGFNASEIANKLNEVKSKINIVAMVDTLKYLKMGGRISATAAVVGSLLSIKPLIGVVDGEVKNIGKVMGVKKAIHELKNMVKQKEVDVFMPLALVWSGEDETMVDQFNAELKKELGLEVELDKYQIGATIGTHVGPGALGFAYFEK